MTQKILIDFRLIDGFIIKEFRDDSNLDYKRDTSEVWGIGILIVVCSFIFWKAKDQLESFMIFKSYAKESIDWYGTIGIWLILNPKLILGNFGYRIDLTFIQCWMIKCLEIGALIFFFFRKFSILITG